MYSLGSGLDSVFISNIYGVVLRLKEDRTDWSPLLSLPLQSLSLKFGRSYHFVLLSFHISHIYETFHISLLSFHMSHGRVFILFNALYTANLFIYFH